MPAERKSGRPDTKHGKDGADRSEVVASRGVEQRIAGALGVALGYVKAERLLGWLQGVRFDLVAKGEPGAPCCCILIPSGRGERGVQQLVDAAQKLGMATSARGVCEDEWDETCARKASKSPRDSASARELSEEESHSARISRLKRQRRRASCLSWAFNPASFAWRALIAWTTGSQSQCTRNFMRAKRWPKVAMAITRERSSSHGMDKVEEREAAANSDSDQTPAHQSGRQAIP